MTTALQSSSPARDQFIRQYGALASFEENQDIAALDARTKQALLLDRKQGQQNLATIDLFQGVVTDPNSLSLAERYQLYRGEPLRALYENLKAQAAFASYQAIADEFKTRPLDPEYPLQDLSDRARRLQVLFEERLNLTAAAGALQEAVYESLPVYEQIIFLIISIAHTIFTLTPAFDIDKVIDQEFTTLPLTAGAFLELKTFTFTHVILKGKKIDNTVKIVGQLSGYRNEKVIKRPIVYFKIYDQNSDNTFGEIWLERLQDKGERYLDVTYLSMSSSTVTGLLHQIAIEVLSREPETILRYAYRSPDLECFGWGEEGIRMVTRRVDDTHNDLLLTGPGNPNFLGGMRIDKSDKPYQETQFTRLDEQHKMEPALIRLGATSKTWEEQIASQPLLGTGRGPVLPQLL